MPQPADNNFMLQNRAQSGFLQLRTSAITSFGTATWLTGTGTRAETLGPSLYAGTAGIAWALAEYARWSGEPWAGELASQALAHAVQHAADVPAAHRFGFHAGWSGIAFAAFNVANLLDDRSHVLAGKRLAEALRAETPSSEFDLIFGSAGATLAFSLRFPGFGDSLLDLAHAAAVRLQSSVRRSAHGSRAAWSSSRALPLTGLGHGTSGVAWALLELWGRRPSDIWLRDLAEQAFAYEAALFDPIEQNWPDLRHYSTRRALRILRPPYQTAWCHGAGGIAVSRLRAYELTGDSPHAEVAATAAATVLRKAAMPKSFSSSTLSLCHGVPGDAEILALVGGGLHHDVFLTASRTLSEAVATHLAFREETTGDWGLEPGLMLGTAGVAWHFLRTLTKNSTPILPCPSIGLPAANH
jgi:lantibiotic modifying enzyme